MRKKASVHLSDESDADHVVIPVVEERIHVGRDVVEKGSINVRKHVHDKNVSVDSILTEENVTIERIPFNRPVEVAPSGVRHEGDTTIVSIVKEELVIQKRLILVEEIHIKKQIIQKDVTEQVNVRREEVVIENKENKD